MLKKLLLSLALSASLFAMHDASLNLNNDDIEVNGNIDLGELNQSDYPDAYFLTLGFLDVDNKESTDPLLSAGFMLRQDITGMDDLRFGIGFKGTYTKVASAKHAAIPINAELAYTLPLDIAMPISISSGLSYAPSVLSFKDADKYFEGRLEASIQIIEQGSLFVGYRKIDLDFDSNAGGDYTYNDSAYIGFKVRF